MPHRYLWYLVSLRIPCAVALSLLANPLGLWYPMWALRSISYLTSASTLLPMWYTSLAPVLCTSTPGLWYTISGVVLLRVTGPLHTYTKHLIHDTVVSPKPISSVHVVGCYWYCIPYTARYSWYYIPYVISYPLGIGIPCGLYAVSHTSLRHPHYYPGLAHLLVPVLAPPRQASGYTISGVCCYGSLDHSTYSYRWYVRIPSIWTPHLRWYIWWVDLDTMPGYLSGGTYLISPYLGLHTTGMGICGIG